MHIIIICLLESGVPAIRISSSDIWFSFIEAWIFDLYAEWYGNYFILWHQFLINCENWKSAGAYCLRRENSSLCAGNYCWETELGNFIHRDPALRFSVNMRKLCPALIYLVMHFKSYFAYSFTHIIKRDMLEFCTMAHESWSRWSWFLVCKWKRPLLKGVSCISTLNNNFWHLISCSHGSACFY